MEQIQSNLLTARFDQLKEPANVQAYSELQGYDGLRAALDMGEADILNNLEQAMLWDRNGSGSAVATRWTELYEAKDAPKYIVCNANEGEPGTFKDKALLEHDPLAVIEGMTIAAYLLHANQGYIYVRGEFQDLVETIEAALAHSRAANYLGENIMGIEGFNFDIKISLSAGAYVTGEPSAMFNAMTGITGRPGGKVNLAKAGLFKQPTLLEDVETFANIPVVLRLGGKEFQTIGTEQSGGTKLICLTGQFKNRGLFEVPMGTPLHDILYGPAYGGGSKSGKPFKFFHFGGQSGMIAKAEDVAEANYSFEGLQANNLTVGTGAIVAMDADTSVLDYLVPVAQFFMNESCGKCTACRIGTVRIYEALQSLQSHDGVGGDLTRLAHMVEHVASQASCPVGRVVANPIFSAMHAFPEEFKAAVNWDSKAVKEVPW